MVTLEGRYNKAKVFTDTLEKRNNIANYRTL